MAPSPTGIKTEAWIWIRGVQMLLTVIIFVVCALEQSRWATVVGMFVPLVILSLLVLLDAAVLYRHRYARGGGRVSTLRWIMDLFISIVWISAIPTICVTHRDVRYSEDGSGPFDVPAGFFIVEIVFTCLNLLLFISTFLMLCVEDVQLRRGSRILPPSAIPSMPTYEQVAREESAFSQSYGAVDSDRAPTIMHVISANGYSTEQPERLSFVPSRTPTTPTTAKAPLKRDYDPGPPTYKA